MIARGAGWRVVARSAALASALLLAPRAARAQRTECEPGEREVRSLDFTGNQRFRDADLALRVATTPSAFTRRTLRIVGAKRCLDSDALRLDVGRLRLFYRRHGYYAAHVDTTVSRLIDGGVRVAFRIQEGEPVVIDTLTIAGLDDQLAAIVDTAGLSLRPGIVFDVTLLQAAIDSMRSRLRNEGYPVADVVTNLGVVDTARRRVTVALAVRPGVRARIGRIVVDDTPLEGAPQRLGDRTIVALSGLHEGDLYREREVVDAQRALYQTDAFQHVDVGIGADSASADSLVTLLVAVRENYLRQVDTEIGWAVLDCFKVRAQLVDKSFLGEARRLELSGQLSKLGYGTPTRLGGGALCAPAIRADTFSARLNYFTSATLRLPTIFGRRAAPTLSLYSERRGEYQAYLRTTLVGGEASLTHDIVRGLPARLAYSLEFGRTEAQPALLCAVFNRCDAESRRLITDRIRPLAVVSTHIERLRTDNPINPRIGTAVRVDLRGAFREIGSDRDIQFAKGLLDASVYRPIASGLTFATRIRLGTVLGRTLSFEDSVGFIPPEERLYAGGAASVRGFQQNELGDLLYIAEDTLVTIPGAGDTVYFEAAGDRVRRVVPTGGTSLIVANFELRARSFFYPDLIQYTLFLDAGDVWQRDRGQPLRPRRASSLYLNNLRWTPGIGVRVFTPVGPFQANVGYNPYNRPAGALYYDAAPTEQGLAPLYCVSPGNRIPANLRASGAYEQVAGQTCPASFQPAHSRSFLSRLTFTFSIGPDF